MINTFSNIILVTVAFISPYKCIHKLFLNIRTVSPQHDATTRPATLNGDENPIHPIICLTDSYVVKNSAAIKQKSHLFMQRE